MIKNLLNEIWKKVKAGETASRVDKFVLWANGLGWYGLMWGALAVFGFVMSAGNGAFLGLINYWDGFLICGSVFVVKNWIAIERIVKKQYDRLLPKSITKK